MKQEEGEGGGGVGWCRVSGGDFSNVLQQLVINSDGCKRWVGGRGWDIHIVLVTG